ncbi:MAG TPA: hypothetical protein VEH84_18640, partial [Alphaproteobacteria bacterium]|nr:hypothetical protein [Alphaproteobacteria bacterium]
MPDHGTVEHSSLHLDLDGLAAGPLQPAGAALFRTDKRADVAGLYRELAEHYRGLVAATDADPAANPVSGLALEISRRMERGELAFDALEQLVQYLSADGFLRRAERMSRYLGTVDPETNIGRLTALFRRLARPEGAEAPIPYAQFAARVEAELFGIVITAHPTFNLSGELMTVLTMLATGRDEGGAPLGEARRRELMQRVLTAEHRPDQPLSLAREHALSLIAIGNIQRALRQVYEVVLDVAREAYPAEWKSLTPRLISVASWVGYDLDGRSDIKWNDILHKRMTVQAMQLRYYMDEVREVRAVAQAGEDLRQTLDLIESRLALAINEVGEEVAMLAGGAETEAGLDRVRRVGRRMYEGLELRL